MTQWQQPESEREQRWTIVLDEAHEAEVLHLQAEAEDDVLDQVDAMGIKATAVARMRRSRAA